MDCEAEVQLVQMRLHDVDGIRQLGFDLTDRTVTVTHTTKTDYIEEALRTLNLGATRLDEIAEDVDTPMANVRVERRALTIALIINLGFFVAELVAGVVSGSLGLIADSLDMAADSGVYALALVAVGHSIRRKKRLAATSGYVQLGLAFAGLIEVSRRFMIEGSTPNAATMIVLSLLALAGNVVTLMILARVRGGEVHLQASWIFTANDVKVNTLVIAAAIGVVIFDSAVPDLLAGSIIFLVVAGGARRVLAISR